MKQTQLIPAIGLAAIVAMSGYHVAQLAAQGLPAGADLSNAATVELRDAQGAAVLRGQFAAVESTDGEQERHAALGPAGADTDAAGEAEVEVSRSSAGVLQQEVEIEVSNVAPNATWTLVIDGNTVGTLTSDSKGHGELEIESGS